MPSQKVDKKTIAITAVADCLEWFDFSLYIFVTPMIAKAFFPGQHNLVALIASFGIFAAGYLMRPLGGLIFGNLGDRWGRKKTIRVATGLMAIPMLITAILPSYHSWGLFAVVILLLMRMLQGFSVGGQHTGVLVMLLEQAPLKHRGFVTSLATFISGFGVLLSSVTVTILIHFLSNSSMYAWGWRLPFALGFLLAVFAFLLQRRLHESPYFERLAEQHKVEKVPLVGALREHPKEIFFVFVLTGFLGIAYYLGAAFLPSFLITIVKVNKSQVMDITTFSAALYAFTAPAGGALSDIIGRKTVLIITTALLMLLSYPVFLFLTSGKMSHILIANALLMIIIAISTAAFVTTVSELFPTQHRYSGMSAGYNVGNALFGGTSPLICIYLVKLFHSHLAPSWYLSISAVITLIIITFMPETCPNVRHKQIVDV